MDLINLKKALSVYVTEPMKGNVDRLINFDEYHCLLSGSMSTSIKLSELYSFLPVDYLDWLKVCDGGLLFDTVILSSKKYDAKFDLDFDTYEDLNSAESYSDLNLPEGYFIFALRSYGDPICFKKEANDIKVYLWDVENNDFTDIWDTFADWITEEIDDAIRLIAEDALEPLQIKLDGGCDE